MSDAEKAPNAFLNKDPVKGGLVKGLSPNIDDFRTYHETLNKLRQVMLDLGIDEFVSNQVIEEMLNRGLMVREIE